MNTEIFDIFKPMGTLSRIFACAATATIMVANATEVLHPLSLPRKSISIEGAIDLNDDVYSADMNVSAESDFVQGHLGLYLDGAFRFLSYSYEYSTEGYIHNYCNLHVNGFNETYLGMKFLPFPNSRKNLWGIDASWRFPPGEGSQLNRFHRLSLEPFYIYPFSRHLTLGASIRYNTFLEDRNFLPGDEFGAKTSIIWSFDWNDERNTGWEFTEVLLYQARLVESENRHLAKKYQKMDDQYQGFKAKFSLARYFGFLPQPIAFGINYEIHHGTLFGFETGHRIGIYAKYL